MSFNLFPKSGLQTKFILVTTIAIILLMAVIGYIAVEREKAILYTVREMASLLL